MYSRMQDGRCQYCLLHRFFRKGIDNSVMISDALQRIKYKHQKCSIQVEFCWMLLFNRQVCYCTLVHRLMYLDQFRLLLVQLKVPGGRNLPSRLSILVEQYNNCWLIYFFFFHWHYSPLWALACRTMSFHFFLSATNSLHLLTPSTWRSLSISSFHPFLGLPLLLVPYSFWVKIFLGILSSSIISRWPNQLILCPSIHFTVFSPLLISSITGKQIWYLNKDRPTWCHLLYYFTIYCSACFEC